MPGVGKSTLGVLLAKELGLEFADTDILIQTREGKTLQQILEDSDFLSLRRIEEEVLLSLHPARKVIATGGSAVYSDAGMRHLKRSALVVFLDLPLPQIRQRIHDFDSRGIARAPEQSLEQLFDERRELYLRYSDRQVDCRRQSPQQLVEKLLHIHQRALSA
jgi:shikimate kinase